MIRIAIDPKKRMFFIAIGLFLSGAGSPGGAGHSPSVLLFDPASTPGPGAGAVYTGSADLNAFPPMGMFSIRFLKTMNPQSSTIPLMSFPYAEGSYTWSYQNTVLTFQPGSPLALGGTYTFFLDPMLRTTEGDALDSTLQWTVRVEDGPTVKSVTPIPGALASRKPENIVVLFDRDMDPASAAKALRIQPSVRHQLAWRDARTAEIKLLEPLQLGNRYEFIFSGAEGSNPAAGADGVVMRDDYVWSYWLDPVKAEVRTTGAKTVDVKFNYPLDQAATGLPFKITPALEGEWTWANGSLARFTAQAPIPFGQYFTLAFPGPLVDAFGPMPAPADANGFSAVPPVKIVAPSEREPDYIRTDYEAFRISFDVPVDHASAEAAFDVSPDIGGDFVWTDSGTGETMEYRLDRLLDQGETYTLTVAPPLRGVDGRNLLVDPVVRIFRTNPYYEWNISPLFGIGSDVQVVDAAGGRKIQFGLPRRASVEFELYPYRIDPFVRLYTGKYGDNGLRFSTDLLPVSEIDASPLAAWSYTDTEDSESPVHETVIPDTVKPGLYVMNLMFQGRLYDQLLVALSRNMLVVKQSAGELAVWMTDFHGKGVASAAIRLYSNRGELIRSGSTDRDGVGRIAVPSGIVPMLITAQAAGSGDGDVTIAGLDWQYRTTDPNSWTLPVSASRRYLSYIYTERPIYRPGQTVRFKAVIRIDNDAAYTLLPAGTPVKVFVRDGRGTRIQSFDLKTNDFGSVEGSFPIGADATLGNYSIETVVDGESQTLSFAVEDYRKPDFGVTLAPLDPTQANNVVSGDTVVLTGTAEYFFGEPVADAKVSAEIYYLQPSYRLSSSEDFWTSSFVWYPSHSVNRTYDTRTGPDGKTRITLDIGEIAEEEGWASWRNSAVRATYALQVTVDDGSHQSISATYILNVFSSSEVIDVDNGGYVRRPGQAFSIRAGARTIAGDPVSGRELTLILNRWDWDEWEYRGAGVMTLTTDAQGYAGQELNLSAGYYQLVLNGKDAEGRAMTDKTWICVFSSADDWFTRFEEEVHIAADRDSYKPGQTAKFIIESTFSGPALLTFERGHVLRSMPVELTAPLTIVEAKLRAEDAPNVFVTVNAWQRDEEIQSDENDFDYWGSNRPESHLRMAATEVRVDAGDRELKVEVSTDRESYAPGDSMKVTVAVSDAGGKPVFAEVSLAAVDESIFSLQAEQSPDIFSAFYAARSRSVRTFDSLSPDRIIISPGGLGGGGGGDGPASDLRSDFQDTAAWFPSLKTDSSGRVSVEIKLPDNLTSWRLTAKAVTRNSLAGQAQKNIIVKKELLVRAVPPRILTTGDKAEITAFVHNYGDAPREVEVTLDAEGLRLQGSATQSITLAPGAVAPVRWPVVVDGINTGSVVISAKSRDGRTDAVRLPLSIQPAASTSVFTQSGEFQGNARIVVPLPQIVPGTSRVTLQLSRTMSGSILGGLEYLTGYPYGCIEQTMSRALPNAVVGRAGSLLGLEPGLSARLEPLIRASIRRLVNFQHRDGGWGWWYDDASTDYQTAWVLFGLAQMEAAGYPVDDYVLDDAVRYLRNDMEKMDIRTRAFALYSMALSGRGDPEAARRLAGSHLQELDPFSQAALALALHVLEDEKSAQVVLGAIEAHGVRNNSIAYWPQETGDGVYTRKTMASTIRTTALVLDAFVAIDPENEFAAGAARYLLSKRHGRFGWGTTNETSFTILALTDYLVREGRKSGESAYQVKLNDRPAAGGVLKTGKNSVTIELPLGGFQPGVNILTITSTGGAELYYDLAAEYVLPDVSADPSGPIKVSRRFLDPGTGKPLTNIRAGQLVRVELTVAADEDASYVLVEDHLPGGLEALNENLNSTPRYTGNKGLDDYSNPGRWEDFGYNFKEIRNDRVSFFITDLRHGTHVYTYLARAMTAGEFLALPVRVSAMYDFSLWGRSGADRLVILREEMPSV
jgi:uncharacterized protein YfaS (alpha-2-macroglobulin family)